MACDLYVTFICVHYEIEVLGVALAGSEDSEEESACRGGWEWEAGVDTWVGSV